jgi:hypothetical protein
MTKFTVNYKVGQSLRTINMEASNLNDAQTKAESKGLKWVDILLTNFKGVPYGMDNNNKGRRK